MIVGTDVAGFGRCVPPMKRQGQANRDAVSAQLHTMMLCAPGLLFLDGEGTRPFDNGRTASGPCATDCGDPASSASRRTIPDRLRSFRPA